MFIAFEIIYSIIISNNITNQQNIEIKKIRYILVGGFEINMGNSLYNYLHLYFYFYIFIFIILITNNYFHPSK